MRESHNMDFLFAQVKQVIGVAHTYQPSLAMRHFLTKKAWGYHSAQRLKFSYLYKGNLQSIAKTEESLYLRTDPFTDKMAQHWVEPELAAFIGDNQEIIAFTLANDLTAISIESRGRSSTVDSTSLGKTWKNSGSLGPHFVCAKFLGDTSNLVIELKIARNNSWAYKQSYPISKCLFSLAEIPKKVVKLYLTEFRTSTLPSKKIDLDEKGNLPYGTVIMLGTGIIVPKKYYCQTGDEVVVSSSKIGKLVNYITA